MPRQQCATPVRARRSHTRTRRRQFVRRPAPTIGDDGGFVPDPDGREIRVWTRVDARLMFEDMWLRFVALDEWASAAG